MKALRSLAWVTGLVMAAALVACTTPPGPDPSSSGNASTDCPAGTAAAGGLCAADSDEAREAADLVQSIFDSESLGSVIIGVWRDGEPIVVGALGESLTGVPATVDMHHRTGNIGHSFLSTLLLQQVEKGTIALDDKLSDYLPDLPGADQITIDMVAHSTSGYAHYTVDPAFQTWFYENPFASLPIDEVVAYGVQDGPTYPPGTDWNFSDTNILILGQVLEVATGKSVPELLQEGILEPTRHGPARPRWRRRRWPTRCCTPTPASGASGRRRRSGIRRGLRSPADGAPTRMTCGTFIEAVGTGSLVSAESHELQLAPDTVGLGTNTDARYYAMGISIVNDWLLTAPGLQGYHASIGYLRDQKLTVVIYFTTTPDYDPSSRSTLIFEPLSDIIAPENAVHLAELDAEGTRVLRVMTRRRSLILMAAMIALAVVSVVATIVILRPTGWAGPER